MSNLCMRPIEIRVFRNASDAPPLDARQVPAAGATVVLCPLGATVTEATVCYGGMDTAVSVADCGSLADYTGGTIWVNGDQDLPLTIGTVEDDGRTVHLVNDQLEENVPLAAGDRLINAAGSSPRFRDPAGMLPITGTLTLDDTGYARVYCPENRVDCLVGGGGLPAWVVMQEVLAGWVRGGLGWVNAKDHPSIQDAIDGLPDEGGTVYIPAGDYVLPEGQPLLLAKSVALVGEGPGLTNLLADAGRETTAMLVQGSNCRIEHLSIDQHGAVGSGTALGIDIGSPSTGLVNIVLRDLAVYNMPAGGIRFQDSSNNNTAGFTISSLVEKVKVAGTRSGFQFHIGRGNTTIVLRQCIAQPNILPEDPVEANVIGFEIVNAANITLDTCEGNPPNLVTPVVWAKQDALQIGASKGANLQILNCDFESPFTPGSSDTTPLVRIDGYSHAAVRDCLFYEFGRGLELLGTYQAIAMGNLFKVIGAGVNPEIVLRASPSGAQPRQCIDSLILNNASETADPSATRSPVRIDQGDPTTPDSTGAEIVPGGVVRLPYVSNPASQIPYEQDGAMCLSSSGLSVKYQGSWRAIALP